MRVVRFVLSTMAPLLICGQRAEAQQCVTPAASGQSTVTCSLPITVSGENATGFVAPTLLEMTVAPTTWSTTPSIADLNVGKTQTQTMTVSVRANRTWIITASGNATFTTSGSLARADKPVSNIRWSTENSGAGTGLSTTAATITSGSAGAATGSNVKTLYWWTTLSWTGDPPGSYSMPITLTLTTP